MELALKERKIGHHPPPEAGNLAEADRCSDATASSALSERYAIDRDNPGFRCAPPWAEFFNRFAVSDRSPRPHLSRLVRNDRFLRNFMTRVVAESSRSAQNYQRI
jgi:hypothetical protein